MRYFPFYLQYQLETTTVMWVAHLQALELEVLQPVALTPNMLAHSPIQIIIITNTLQLLPLLQPQQDFWEEVTNITTEWSPHLCLTIMLITPVMGMLPLCYPPIIIPTTS